MSVPNVTSAIPTLSQSIPPVSEPAPTPSQRTITGELPAVVGVDHNALFINRELSWLEFNARVLAEAENPAVPLYERLKFLGIVQSNLDEFFMVRVAGLKQQLIGDVNELPPDGLTPAEQLVVLSTRAHELADSSYRAWNDDIRPALAREGIVLVRPAELAAPDLEMLDRKFRSDIFPVLTPITIDPNHPFPHLKNKSINLGVHVHAGGKRASMSASAWFRCRWC